MTDLVAAAVEVQRCLAAGGVRGCIIGGLAVQRWGEPRATQDVDMTVLAPPGEESRPVDLLLGQFASRRPDARAFALESRVLLIAASNRVAVDVALAGTPFEQEVLERATPWEIERGVALVTCSAEDLLLYKLVAARPRDLADIEGVVRRQAGRLDVGRIRTYASLFGELMEHADLARPFEDALRRAQP